MYRVDKRIYNLNDIIEPQKKSYQESDNFNSNKQKLEGILMNKRPDDKKADRKSGLYIFAELSDAIRFCCIMPNSYIYKVSKSKDTILYHRGDMNWTEIMNEFLDNDKTLKQMAGLYWQGRKTFKPCWEMLVNKVCVTEIIVGDDNVRGNLCMSYNHTGGNVERMNFYIDVLNQHRQE